jgi:hypothetical protein
MSEFKIIKETINDLEYQETEGLLTDRGVAYLKELKQALQLQQTGVSGLSEQLCGNLDENYYCKNMCLTRCVDGNKFYK